MSLAAARRIVPNQPNFAAASVFHVNTLLPLHNTAEPFNLRKKLRFVRPLNVDPSLLNRCCHSNSNQSIAYQRFPSTPTKLFLLPFSSKMLHPSTTIVPHPIAVPPAAIAKTPPSLSASPSCVSGVGLSPLVDEVPSLGSLSLSSYQPLPFHSYPSDQFASGANRNSASVDGVDGRMGSEEGTMGSGRSSMERNEEVVERLKFHWPLNGMAPLWEEGEEEGTELEDNKAFFCPAHSHWHQHQLPGLNTTQQSPLKTERPPSVAFVGPESGTEQQFVDPSPHHPHPHHYFAENNHLQFRHDFPSRSTDYPWDHSFSQFDLNNSSNSQFFANFNHFSSDGTYFEHNNGIVGGHYGAEYATIGGGEMEEEGEEQQSDRRIIDISASVPFDHGPTVLFDPLSVGTSASWSGAESGHSSTDEAAEYSSLSQDEIYEQIQRECAEIEHRSSSSGGDVHQQTKIQKSKGMKTRTISAKKASPMKKKTYSGRASVSSLDSADALPAPATGGRRRERKKELNRVAATRYREKKRKEREQTSDELLELEQRNTQLKADIAAVQAEMDYLKGLAAEIETARRQKRGRR